MEEEKENKQYKSSDIMASNTIIYPVTMVVIVFYAYLAYMAVEGSFRLYTHTKHAHEIDVNFILQQYFIRYFFPR